MAYELRLPDMGEGLTEAEVLGWMVSEGDEVAANQPLLEVETDKAVVEIPSPRAGFVLHLGAALGDTIAVGHLVAVIGDRGETWTAGAAPKATQGSDSPGPAPGRETARGGDVRAVPLVRKLAQQLGVDLAAVKGSGARGQITRGDVEQAARSVQPGGEEMTKLRRTIAEHMTRSWTEIPHVTVWGPVEATRLLEVRTATGHPLDALLIEAVLPVLAEHPDFSATFDGSTLRREPEPSIGIAVATEAGLIVPVLHGAATLDRAGRAEEVKRLVAGAAGRSLTADELRGQTFTITNVGAVGGGYGTPIIPHGTTAILSVGRAGQSVVARDGEPVVAPVFPIALSFDHRVIDGAAAALFLNRVTENIETFS
ncbi:MAG: dihydrolipoamide acetyltransferase family protein [Acidimicrobiia bacterium]